MDSGRIPTILRRGVGRTILLLFVVAGVVPVVFTAWLAIMEIERAATAKTHETLRQNAKAYGVDVLTRLSSAADKAQEIASLIEAGATHSLADRSYLLDDFEAVWTSTGNGERAEIFGDPSVSIVGALVEFEYLANGGTQLLIVGESGAVNYLLLRLVYPESGAPKTVGLRLKPDRIWGSIDQVPYNTQICVYLASGIELYCTQPMHPSVYKILALGDGGGARLSAGEFGDQIAAAWQLFLMSSLQAPSLDIVASQPKAYALRSNTDFRRIFIPALGLVIILVGLLSFKMIGTSLGPLAALTKAARRVADGDLDVRVDIDSRNEFGTLGRTFNTMAARMGRQIDMLGAMSEIDKLILTGAGIEDVCEAVSQHLARLTNCDAVAIVTGLDGPVGKPAVIAVREGEVVSDLFESGAFSSELLSLARTGSANVDMSLLGDAIRPIVEFGQTHVAIVPVLLQGELLGQILVASRDESLLTPNQLRQCDDIAERFAVALDSFRRKEALYRKANFDDLTGLPNRQLLKDRLEELLQRAASTRQSGALLYLDLDRFKEVNDVYGHSVGDMVLVQAAERIVGEMRDDDIVARLGGDEFVVILPNVSRHEVIKTTASRLLSRLTDIFSVAGVNHFVGASIGIVVFPEDGESVESLLKNADAAMYRAKEAGRARFEFFNHELNAEGRRKIELERELRGAVERNELQLYYQPQFFLDTGALSGAEALLRWQHGQLGNVSPAEFIPLAEESDLIIEMGVWIAERCASDIRRLLDEGLHPGPISINVSARQLRDLGFVGTLTQVLARNQIEPTNIRIEVTETAVAQNRDTAIELLEKLRSKGIRIAIDDFGTGYSSLSYLQNMPYDVIKIDKSFVDLIENGETAVNICRTIIRMAHELGKTSVAEGVESQSQVNFLRESGCDVVQGYFYAKPMPFDEFVQFIRKVDLHTHRRKALELV